MKNMIFLSKLPYQNVISLSKLPYQNIIPPYEKYDFPIKTTLPKNYFPIKILYAL
jgi:hypothetical protein